MTSRSGLFRFRPGWLSSVACVALATVSCGDDSTGPGSSDVVDESLIGEVQTFDVAEINGCNLDDAGNVLCAHVEEPVSYDQTPPIGGPHAHFPQVCQFWDEPLFNEAAVHSLEHGAVWITFDPDLSDEQVDIIRGLAEGHAKVMASPWGDGDHPTPVVLSAWGAQLWLEELPDPAAEQFVADHLSHPDSPKPDASCNPGEAYEGTQENPL